jgi:surface antigen
LPQPINLNEKEIWSAPGMRWNGIQYLRFSLNDEEKKMHQSAVYHALNQSRDGEITSWYSDSKKNYGKVKIIQSFPISDGYCRIYQSLINFNNSARHFTNNACKRFYAENWLFLK